MEEIEEEDDVPEYVDEAAQVECYVDVKLDSDRVGVVASLPNSVWLSPEQAFKFAAAMMQCVFWIQRGGHVSEPYTPGPWSVGEENESKADILSDHGEMVAVARGRPPATLIANARLIAAAPDMLAALKQVIASNAVDQVVRGVVDRHPALFTDGEPRTTPKIKVLWR